MNEELKIEYLKLCCDYKDLESRIQEEYNQLGKAIYDITERKINTINQLVEEMISLKLRIKELKEIEMKNEGEYYESTN